MIPNIYLPYSSNALATWTDWISFTSGGMQEFWSKWGTGVTGHFTGDDWTYRQQFLAATQRAGKIFLGLSYAPNERRSLDALRALDVPARLGRRPSAVLFEWRSGVDPTASDWMADIGAPRGARYAVGAAWRRDYSGAPSSSIPPATVWVSLDAPYVNQDGHVVSSLALAPATGTVPAEPRSVSSGGAEFRARRDGRLPGSRSKQGRSGADLYWSGVRAGTAVDIFRDGVKIAPLRGNAASRIRPFRIASGRRAAARSRGRSAWRTRALLGHASLGY